MGTPNRDRSRLEWTRILRAVEDAVDLSADERERLLVRKFADAPGLLAEARALLAEDGEGDDHLELLGGELLEGVTAGGHAPRPAVRRAGPYELGRLLGRGGMGAVYLATRVDGTLERRVAVKLVPPSVGTDDVVARFERERQVQSDLSHVGIATLLDGGATDDGLPYLVMEYVEGERIDHWCDAHRLVTEERLRLFLKVADAVAHAHENRVVHRDIKPSNILVNERGEPKLLDFGIAKLLDPESPGADDMTLDGMQRMTPAYASPEQLRRRPVTPATDLYSLGILLFELLTGHAPHALEGCSPAEVERIVCEEEPLRPSRAVLRPRDVRARDRKGATTLLTAASLSERRSSTPRALQRRIGGDLERIVMMCLRKEPARRYASVRALMQDVERFLAGRPILARPDTFTYRTTRFVQRNRWAVAIAGGVVASLSTALAFSLLQYDRTLGANARFEGQKTIAEERLADLRSFRKAQLEQLAPLLSEVPGALAASERLVELNLEHIDREAAHASDDPELTAELAGAYILLADLQGNPLFATRGESGAARETYEKALDLARRLEAHHPDFARAPEVLGKALVRSGNFLAANGEREEAVARFRATIEMAQRRIAEPRGAVPQRMHYLVSNGWRYIAYTWISAGRFEAAREASERTIETVHTMLEVFPDLAFFLDGDMCIAQQMLAECERELGRPEVALALLEPAEERLKEILRSHPTSANARHQLASMRTSIGRALAALGRNAEAERDLLEPLAELERLAQESAGDMRAGRWLIEQQLVVGNFLLRRSRVEEAAAYLKDAHVLATELAARDPEQFLMQRKLANCELHLGRLARGRGELQRAAELLESARARLESLLARAPGDFELAQPLVVAYRALGELHAERAGRVAPSSARRDREAALDWFVRAGTLARELLAQDMGGVELRTEAREIEAAHAALLSE